ncbi:anti-sigma factor [Cellulomonas sp. S1-8]|uniref:anti-sigma factor n=1 Tax=Cellulomonas sp. S1-8 TaxID=2904790 RepID=UPI002244BF39|nr:anti-sigma factor [Cellulomonas sp. S1-8]UZN03875.1 anti-sigma factor [Cellulomonas sp. S1-8]
MDDETLALLALGEQVGSGEELAHVDACTRCGDEVATLRGVADLARESGPEPQLVAPAPQVWDRVAAELGLGERAYAAAGGVRSLPLPPHPDPSARTTTEDAPAGREQATVTPLGPRRRVRRAWLAVAAAAGLVVGGAGATALWQEQADRSTLLASAVLEPLPGWTPGGTAEVRTASDGSRSLVVDLDAEPGGDGFLEVWLLRPDVSGLVSLGTLDGTSGEFALPAGLDLTEFPVVDVSDEPLDGEPAHSGVSVVRGALEI